MDGSKGFFSSYDKLLELVPSPTVGDWAITQRDDKWVICVCELDGRWKLTDQEYEHADIDMSQYVKYIDLYPYAKKTDLIGLGGSVTVDPFLSLSSSNPVENKAIYAELNKKASKSSLSQYATNEQLSDYATKSSLVNYAKKSDISNFVTRDELTGQDDTVETIDLSKYATKADLNNK